jgi:ribosomal protein S10
MNNNLNIDGFKSFNHELLQTSCQKIIDITKDNNINNMGDMGGMNNMGNIVYENSH